MNASSSMGLKVTVGAEHKDGQGNLISRCVTIHPPVPPVCPKLKCLWRFFWKVVYHGLLTTYHKNRVGYAEKHRHESIPLKYRTGDDSPENTRQAMFEIVKLRLRR